MNFNYTQYDATDLAQLIKTAQVSPQEVLTAAISQIERENPHLNAVITPLFEQAHVQLAHLDLSLPLAGVPFLLKDILADYQGVPTSFGSRWLQHAPAPTTSKLVQRYLQAGLVIVGKTNVPEFGLGAITEPQAFGPTQNPCKPGLSPGGSSGGSAAAVAAGMVPAAHGNDGGGSIRIPASCCGLFGLKPTRGLVPVGPMLLHRGWQGLIVEHVLTRSVRDSAILLDIGANTHIFSAQVNQPPNTLRIGYTTQPILGHQAVHADCAKAVDIALAHCAAAGHSLTPITLPMVAETLCWAYQVLVTAELHAMLEVLSQRVGRMPQHGEIELLSEIFSSLGCCYTAADYARALMIIDTARIELDALFQQVDIIVTPVLSQPPPMLGSMQPKGYETLMLELLRRWPIPRLMDKTAAIMSDQIFDYVAFTPLCNMTGHPAMSVPLHQTADNIPIGVHFMAKWHGDGVLLQLARQLELAGMFWVKKESVPKSFAS